MLRGNANCLVDEATKAVLRISSGPIDPQPGCYVYSVRADQLPAEVQALSDTPVPFDIEAVFIGNGLTVLHDDASIVVTESTDGEAEARQAKLLARRFESMKPTGPMEAAILGLVRISGADAVAQAAMGAAAKPKPKRRKKKDE